MSISNLSAAAPTGVFPQCNYTSFQESRVYPLQASSYHDGTTERSLITDGVNPPVSIRTYTLSVRATAANVSTIRSFFESHLGGLTPFYWYNPMEVIPGTKIGSNYDASGTSITGRHTVRFTNQDWTETVGLARTDLTFALVEVS